VNVKAFSETDNNRTAGEKTAEDREKTRGEQKRN
jgi:hypothetical protein